MMKLVRTIALLMLALALLMPQAGFAEADAGEAVEAPAKAPSAEVFFAAVAGLEPGTAGASLKTAVAASEVCAFAEACALYNPAVEAPRADIRAAYEAMDEAARSAFWEKFDAVRALIDDCLEDFEANRGLFEDAGVADAMDVAMSDPLTRVAWMNLRDDMLALGGDAGALGAAFSQWNPDAPALNALVEYVEAVTDEASPDYIPRADRIVTFDMDGTLIGELFPTYLEVILLTERILADPTYAPDAEMLEFGRMTRDHAPDKSFPDDYDYEFSYHQARAFAGMTLNEYADFITRFLVREADGFEGMAYAEAYYLPMAEVVEYLHDNGFKCYIVSGSDRFIIRAFMEGVLDIPSEQIIGSDTALEARDQGGADGIDYVFTGNDTLVRTDRLLVKDLKTNKVLQIAQEIGRQPVLSFGNSSGDASMNNYALYNNRYRSAAFQLVADDDVRDYGDPEKGAKLREQWEAMGYNVISMRDDWKTIYGEDVTKTGEFHWLDDYADDRIPARAE